MRMTLLRCLRDGTKGVLKVWNAALPFTTWDSIVKEHESMLGWLELRVDDQVILSNKYDGRHQWKEEHPVKEQTPPDCTSCNGTGRVWYPGCDDIDSPCHDCNGIGVIIEPE